MGTKKKYTNQAFTKRVEHDAGHIPKKRISEPAVCGACGAIYTHGRWSFDQETSKNVRFEGMDMQEIICPACLQIRNGEPEGYVYISGDFIAKHREEIENLLRNEEEKLNFTNPLARIMKIENEKEGFTLTTTTVHLAQHFGRALHRAYGGEVRYDVSREDVLARVYWERD